MSNWVDHKMEMDRKKKAWQEKHKECRPCITHKNTNYICCCPICHAKKCICYLMDGVNYGFWEPGDYNGIRPG